VRRTLHAILCALAVLAAPALLNASLDLQRNVSPEELANLYGGGPKWCIAWKNCFQDCEYIGDGLCQGCLGAQYQGCFFIGETIYNCDETFNQTNRAYCGRIWWGFLIDGFWCWCDNQANDLCFVVPNSVTGIQCPTPPE